MITVPKSRFPGWRHMSGVERRNARMHAIFDRAKLLQALQPAPVYYACEICGHNHPWAFDGDCRDDANRFTDEQLDANHGGAMNYELRSMDERVAADGNQGD